MKHFIPLFVLAATLSCCAGKQGAGLSERKEAIEKMENAALTEEQIERKARSEAYCKKYDIPTIEHLPAIESEEETTLRTKDEVIQRALVLCYLGLKSEGLEAKHLQDFDKKYNISPYLSEEEKMYASAASPTDEQRTAANWRYESLHVLLWALGHIDTLAYPSVMCNVGEDVKLIFSKTREEFVSKSTLRSKKEILDQADLIYRIDWACVNARSKNMRPPSALDGGVVYERHYVLNWLIRYMDQEWDGVSTDT